MQMHACTWIRCVHARDAATCMHVMQTHACMWSRCMHARDADMCMHVMQTCACRWCWHVQAHDAWRHGRTCRHARTCRLAWTCKHAWKCRHAQTCTDMYVVARIHPYSISKMNILFAILFWWLKHWSSEEEVISCEGSQGWKLLVLIYPINCIISSDMNIGPRYIWRCAHLLDL